MAIPNVSGALTGWTTKRPVIVITQSVVNFKTVETEAPAVDLDINIQPIPPEQVNRKPEEQRSWKWYTIYVKHGPLLKVDDRINVDGPRYKIENVRDWTPGGYQHYEAIEDFVSGT